MPAASPIFEGRVAHGYLILSFAAGLFVVVLAGLGYFSPGSGDSGGPGESSSD